MQIVSGIDKNVRTAIAIGKFDGVHKGHMKLLHEIISHRDEGLLPLVFTFKGSVSDFYSGNKSRVLTTDEEKLKLLEDAGIGSVYMMSINKDTVSYDPEAFVREILVEKLHAGLIAAGGDLSFGYKGRGNMSLLERLSEGGALYRTAAIEKVKHEDQVISSTLIRNEVSSGNMERAGAMLGRAYSLEGMVVHGKKLGRTIGIPTANVIPDDEKLMPPFGVYSSVVELGDRQFKGITNIGVKPTVSDEPCVTAETHIFDFDEDIYGAGIRVSLVRFVRPEKKFGDIDSLKEQMLTDITGIRNSA
ncbi:MAG: bifunctional riboflavin kinase/FAD synthetase [Lachnospiraceae bacterium]|nr:bifunctional riboflavin kinase/FAD synthetase [Lachnospiraceae bacterium]